MASPGIGPLEFLHAVVADQHQTQAAIAPDVQARHVQTVLDVASEFSGLVADMDRLDMTPAQIARLDMIFAGFEEILKDVRTVREELQAATQSGL